MRTAWSERIGSVSFVAAAAPAEPGGNWMRKLRAVAARLGGIRRFSLRDERSTSAARCERDQQSAVVVVGGEEVADHRLLLTRARS